MTLEPVAAVQSYRTLIATVRDARGWRRELPAKRAFTINRRVRAPILFRFAKRNVAT